MLIFKIVLIACCLLITVAILYSEYKIKKGNWKK